MPSDSKNETIIICGTARLPKEMSRHGDIDRLWIELELTVDDFEIVDFSGTMLSHLSEKILRNVLLGHKVEEGIELAIEAVEKRVFSTIKKATIAALEDIRMSYKKIRKE